MKMLFLLIVVTVLVAGCRTAGAQKPRYSAAWESIDSRPNPQWFQDAKFGIFIHWGVYSVPAWGPKGRYAEWYWHDMQDKNGQTWKFHVATYGKNFQYQDFAPMFKAELFDPKQWADLFVRSGARYVVLTSKHHEGFCMWPSAQSWNWNSVDIGPHRDLCGELIEAIRARGIRAGFYYSLYEWFHPLYLSDVHKYVDAHMLPQLKDLVERYKPDILWPDGEWDHPSEVWRSAEFLAWLFNESSAPKDIAVNDRWGKECRNTHGGFATPEYGHIPEGKGLTQQERFEECQGMGRSFGYNRNEAVGDYRTATELIHLLADNVSRGGNLLLDIGPSADGRIPEIMQERLVDMGQWLAVNGDAIYGTRRWRETAEGDLVRYTTKNGIVYVICLQWPGRELALSAPEPEPSATVCLLGRESEPLSWRIEHGKMIISIPPLSVAEVPCGHAYVLKLTGAR